MISAIEPDSPLLEQVVSLGDTDRAFLGFFPQEAFRRAAERGLILVATEGNIVQGYVLYYVAKARAVIQHLCVAEAQRKKGIARALIQDLRRRTEATNDGILLHCNRTFPAYDRWLKLGFAPVGEKRGRGKEANTLTQFWLDFQKPSLVSVALEQSYGDRIRVAIDANIFYDLHRDDGQVPKDLLPLRADWLRDLIVIALTDEIFAEIDRHPSPTHRGRQKDLARGYAKLTGQMGDFAEIYQRLSGVLPQCIKESDRRHLAHVAVSCTQYFVTRDDDLLRHADLIRRTANVTVLSPAALVVSFDELERNEDYEPARLSGSSLHIAKATVHDLGNVPQAFLNTASGERRAMFCQGIEELLGNPQLNPVLVLREGDQLVGLLAMDCRTDNSLRIVALRVRHASLAGVISRNLLLYAVKTAVSEHRAIVILSDEHATAEVRRASGELGFFSAGVGSNLMKIALSGVYRIEQLSTELLRTAGPTQLLHDLSRQLSDENQLNGVFLAAAERALFPAKIETDALPAFIVPVQARWAMHLFDEHLAKQDLYGGVNQLALNWEHAYYRSGRSRFLRAPGRILWYVSENRRFVGSGAIRAASSLMEVVVGPAKTVYRQFKRLGVFEWKHITERVQGDVTKQIMGFRFGLSELARSPIPFADMRETVKRHLGTLPPFSTPLAIPWPCYRELYEQGNML